MLGQAARVQFVIFVIDEWGYYGVRLVPSVRRAEEYANRQIRHIIVVMTISTDLLSAFGLRQHYQAITIFIPLSAAGFSKPGIVGFLLRNSVYTSFQDS